MTVPEDLLIQIFEKSAACMLVMANPPNFTVVMASESYLSLTGLKREQLIGRGAFEVFPDDPNDPAGANTTKQAILDVIASNKKGRDS